MQVTPKAKKDKMILLLLFSPFLAFFFPFFVLVFIGTGNPW
jgi:hypothetical protein